GFLGPETTFTHQALLQALAEMPEALDTTAAEMVPFASVATAATDLLAGQIDALMAPIENSVEGGVSGTLDVLAATDSITIVAEQTVQISFVLAAREDTALDALTTVSSHPHAQAQVQGWLRENVPGTHIAAASSTAAAARALAAADAAEARGRAPPAAPGQLRGWLRESGPGRHLAAAPSTAAAARDRAAADADEARGRAAVCSPLAAEHFGLTVLADGIEDYDGAITRFVLVT